ncbi:MAG: Dickkopf N-terminal cysteine-rich domain-containing protein [Polyangiales bacterium]
MSRRLIWLSFCLLSLGCERNLSVKQLDEPCTRTAQCEEGLACLSGVCRPESERMESDPVDGGT